MIPGDPMQKMRLKYRRIMATSRIHSTEALAVGFICYSSIIPVEAMVTQQTQQAEEELIDKTYGDAIILQVMQLYFMQLFLFTLYTG